MKIKKLILKVIDITFPHILYSSKSFSQDGEDVVLNSFYENRKKHKGFYVDIGAHHPFRFSNTQYFYKKGWRGINIEPTVHLYKTFKRHRRKDINLNIGISNSPSSLTFYEFNEPALNGFDKELSTKRDSEGKYKIINTREIKVQRLSDVLDKNLPKNKEIDFFNIDVEGLDLDVLHSNNWDKYSPNYILIEGNVNFNNISQNEIYNYLSEKKYRLSARTRRTFLFEKND
jgi:FkbM family methyltransferase